MLNASIFGNMLSAPKSPEEYAAERENLLAARQSNMLNQSKIDEYQRGVARQGELRNLLAGGADAGALRKGGFLDEAANMEKNAAEVALKKSQGMKYDADAQSAQYKLMRDKLDHSVSALVAAPDPDSARQRINDGVAKGMWSMQEAQRMLQQVPNDPAGYQSWRIGKLQEVMNAKDQFESHIKQQQIAETGRHNKATEEIQERNNIRSNERMSSNAVRGVGGGEQPKPPKPLPVGALKMQQETLDAIGTAGGINADLGAVLQQVESGSLKLGPVTNAVGSVRNTLGMSDENSQNLATFKATLEKLRNDSLRLNKGVQTDGDAQRAWNELISNINDPKVVSKRLKEIQALNERAVEFHQMNIDTLRNNYGAGSIDTTARSQPKPAIQSGGGLTKQEQDELAALRKRFGGVK